MAEPYIGEIRQFGGNFAPRGWAFCNGQMLSIAENEALFALIGTTYGGNGQTTFGLPDLRGRVPLHQGGGFSLGQTGGVEQVTLTTAQLPAHSHPVAANDAGGIETPAGNVWGKSSNNSYGAAPGNLGMNASSVSAAGGNQPHDNMHPFLAVSYILATEGIFPQQN